MSALPEAVRALYPWEGRFLEVPGGHRLHYLDVGQGPPVLMVHGNPTWSFYWRDLVHALSGDHRCIVPDHLGCGLSDKPPGHPLRIADHVDHLAKLVTTLDLRDITLVVHDWGGPIGLLAALRDPARIARVVVFNSAAFLLPLPRVLRALRLPLYGPLVVQGLNGFLEVGFRTIVAHPERFTRAVRAGYRAPWRTWADRRAILRFIEEIPIEAHHHNRNLLRALEQDLPRLAGVPWLVVWGGRDWIFGPAYHAEWRRRFPHAEHHLLDDVAHWVVEEAPERVVPLVRGFLDRHEG